MTVSLYTLFEVFFVLQHLCFILVPAYLTRFLVISSNFFNFVCSHIILNTFKAVTMIEDFFTINQINKKNHCFIKTNKSLLLSKTYEIILFKKSPLTNITL